MSISEQFNETIRLNIEFFSKEIDSLFEKTAIKSKDIIKEAIIKNGSYATRKYLNSIATKVSKTSSTNRIEFGANARSKGYEYASNVEFGRRKGKGVSEEGRESIRKWLLKKVSYGFITLPQLKRKNKRTRLTTKERKDNLIDGLVYLIARKLKEKGYRGKYYLRKGFEFGKKELDSGLGKIVKEVFG